MKILFKNTTKYDKENRDNFTNFHKDKFGKKEAIKGLFILIAIIYIILYNVIYLNWRLLLILIPVFIIVYFINKYKVKKKNEKKRKQKDKEFTFFFYEPYIKIKFKRQFERINYFEIKKIYETNENFFLYTDEKSSLILDKEGFSIGNSKDFSAFIKRKCPFKYSNKDSN